MPDKPLKLDTTALQNALATLPGWYLENGELVRHYQFPDFLGSMAFINKVAKFAEQASHHPDIDIRYNRVRLALVTHDAGGITQNDIAMATELNQEL